MGIFEIRSRESFGQGWLQTLILLISASSIARITGMSHQHLAFVQHFVKKKTAACLSKLYAKWY
jgi:hypothetical protein